MTTIPGHNIVIQQSGAVHEAIHHVKPNAPLPEQLADHQAVREALEKSSVQETEKPEKAKQKEEKAIKEREARRERERQKRNAEKKNKKKSKKDETADSPGSLLNTIA